LGKKFFPKGIFLFSKAKTPGRRLAGMSYSLADLPPNDSGFIPDGASWCQVKVLGKDGSGFNVTPYSNIVSVGTWP